MDKRLEVYLEKVNRYLKGMSLAEREDIIKEIRSSMIEMQNDGLVVEQILQRLGDPKEMARAYLGDMIIKTKGIGFKKVVLLITYWSVVGFTGMFVLPILGILAPTFILGGIICVFGGVFKVIGTFLGYDMSFIIVQFAGRSFGPFMTLVISLFMGALFAGLGFVSWQLLKAYIAKVSDTKRYLEL